MRYFYIVFLAFVYVFLHTPVSHAQKLNDLYLGIQKRIQENPDDLNAKMDLAYVFSQGLEFERAVKLYEEVIRHDEKNKRALTELCVLHVQMNVKEKAIDYCQKAVNLWPEEVLFWDNLGLAFYRLGEPVKSLDPFSEALKREPENGLVKFHVGQVFERLGFTDLAKNVYLSLVDSELNEKNVPSVAWQGLYRVYKSQQLFSEAKHAAWQSYEVSENPLFLGRVVLMTLREYEVLAFTVIALFWLWGCHYLGKRLNRFLKNEIDEV
jgi:tetratricopeptide (TPR) repeat protein